MKRGGRDGGTFRKMVSICLKRGNIAHIVILLNVRLSFQIAFVKDVECEIGNSQKVCVTWGGKKLQL